MNGLEEEFDEVEPSEESSELFEHVRIVADKGQSFVRIDVFLQNRIENISRNKIQQTAKAGNILVNNQVVKSNYRVRPNDIITVVFSYPPREVEIFPEDIPLSIVYEDDYLMVINKQPDLVVHPGHGNFSGTLLNALAFYFEKSGQKVQNRYGYLVHRIDKDTSGLLLIAKDELTQSMLAKQFFHHTVDRRYHALVWGNFTEEEGTISGHIGRSIRDRKLMAVYADGASGKEAVTHFQVVKRLGYVTLVECKLETGRTHQIRVHFKHIGHPLFNDASYGGDAILKGTSFTRYKQFVENCFKILPRQALHAKTLGFVHPVKKKFLQFDSEWPADFAHLIQKCEAYTGSRDTTSD